MRLPEPFQCEVRYADRAWLISLSGELDIFTVPEVSAAAMVVRAVEGDLTLDLRGLDFMDGSGVHLVLDLQAAARRYGFDFRVLTGGGLVQRVLVVSGAYDQVSTIDNSATWESERRTQYAVIATDIGGLITLWNDEAERLYGWSALEVLGRPIMELTVGPQDRALAEEIMAAVQRVGFWEGEFNTCRKGGDRFRARVRNALITDLNGNFTGFVGVSIRCAHPELVETAPRQRPD